MSSAMSIIARSDRLSYPQRDIVQRVNQGESRIASLRIVPEAVDSGFPCAEVVFLLSRVALPLQRTWILSGMAALWRRAQTPSRLAVAPTLQHVPASAGHTLTVSARAATLRAAGLVPSAFERHLVEQLIIVRQACFRRIVRSVRTQGHAPSPPARP